MDKGECAVLKANEKSVSSIIPTSILSKLGIVSFAAVLINAIIKRAIKDLKEIRDDVDEGYYEDVDNKEEIERTEPIGRMKF